MTTKYKFIKKDKINKSKPPKRRAVRKSNIKVERLVVMWAVENPRNLGITKFLRAKGYKPEDIQLILHKTPAEIWHTRASEIKDGYTREVVKSQMDFMAEMHDQLIKSSKLGMAKAIEMMTKMKIEPFKDKKGKISFTHYKPTDLKACMESLQIAMRIMRTSYGLPNDEGAMHVWRQLNINMNPTAVVTPGQNNEDAEREAMRNLERMEELLTYDDIKLLIEAERSKQKAIETTATEVKE